MSEALQILVLPPAAPAVTVLEQSAPVVVLPDAGRIADLSSRPLIADVSPPARITVPIDAPHRVLFAGGQGMRGPAGPMVPTDIAADEIWSVGLRQQAHAIVPINNRGIIDLKGTLVLGCRR